MPVQPGRVGSRLVLEDAAVTGDDIHAGVTSGPALARPAVWLACGPHGAISEDGQGLGTYLHGLFDTPKALGALLRWAGRADGAGPRCLRWTPSATA